MNEIEKKIYDYFKSLTSEESKWVSPSYKMIQNACDIYPKQISESLKTLQESGMIFKESKSRTKSKYRIADTTIDSRIADTTIDSRIADATIDSRIADTTIDSRIADITAPNETIEQRNVELTHQYDSNITILGRRLDHSPTSERGGAFDRSKMWEQLNRKIASLNFSDVETFKQQLSDSYFNLLQKYHNCYMSNKEYEWWYNNFKNQVWEYIIRTIPIKVDILEANGKIWEQYDNDFLRWRKTVEIKDGYVVHHIKPNEGEGERSENPNLIL